MSDDPRYRAHLGRVNVLRRASSEPLASYWGGYRFGMVRGDREANGGDDLSRDEHTDAAMRGYDAERGLDRTLPDYARWCGYYDGRRWNDVTAHRGLLRLAIAVSERPNSRFALDVLGISDASLRQMLAGTRPIPATRYTELLDLVSADPDR